MLDATLDASGRENLIGERVANIKQLRHETCRRRAEELNYIPKPFCSLSRPGPAYEDEPQGALVKLLFLIKFLIWSLNACNRTDVKKRVPIMIFL